MKEKQDPPGIFYFWRGERPLHPNAPQLHGTGEIKLESAERGAGYFTTLSETQLEVNAKTSGVYLDRKSTRLNSVTNAHLVCRLLLEKKKTPNHKLDVIST